MTLLDAALAETVKGRIQELEKQIESADESLKLLQGHGGEYGRGIYTGRKAALKAEILFLTDLHLALTNTMKKPAKNPNPSLQAEPAP